MVGLNDTFVPYTNGVEIIAKIVIAILQSHTEVFHDHKKRSKFKNRRVSHISHLSLTVTITTTHWLSMSKVASIITHN